MRHRERMLAIESIDYRLRGCLRVQRTAEVSGHGPIGDGVLNGALDASRCAVLTEMFTQHCTCQDRCDGVGDRLANDIWSRAVHRLE